MKPDHLFWEDFLVPVDSWKPCVAERAAQRLLEPYTDNGGSYFTLSNSLSLLRKMEKAKRIWEIMAERKIKESPGGSLIEVDGVFHKFIKGDSSHETILSETKCWMTY